MVWRESPPFGGLGGYPFSDDYISVIRLVGFVIRHARYVSGIQGIYQQNNGTLLTGQWHGGLDGAQNVVMLDEDEIILNVSGRAGWYVDQITFDTNKKRYGPYGGDGGKDWELGRGAYRLGGLYGRAGIYLDAIGFCYAI